jgi:hypothetical protein
MYELISVDDHIIEPPDVWTERLPSRFADQAPRVVELDGGTEAWVINGRPEPTMGLNAVAGKPREQWGAEPGSDD